jgi:hypothetical protein
MKMEKQHLVETLKVIAKKVEDGDSFEGNIKYSCLEFDLKPDEFEVTATFRTGNLKGQGGMAVIE